MWARMSLVYVSCRLPCYIQDRGHTLKVGHICPDIRVQGVNDHLAVSRASDLDAPIDKARRGWSAPPSIILSDVLGLREEVKEISLVELSLTNYSSLKQRFPALVKCAVKEGKEDTGVLAEDMTVLVGEVAEDVDLAQNAIGIGCHCDVCECICTSCCVWLQGTRKEEEECNEVCDVRRRLGGR